ncbi:MAG: hypothetical protein ACREJC_17345 [Tepidisphaeraceae bacterium]
MDSIALQCVYRLMNDFRHYREVADFIMLLIVVDVVDYLIRQQPEPTGLP